MARSSGLKVVELEPFGAEVELDLETAACEEVLREVFALHGLLVFRDQALSMEDQKRVAGYFGPVCEHWSTVGYVSNRRSDGILGNSEVSFHSDNSYTSDPLLAVSLHALNVPYETTSTRFASGDRALAALPPDLRERIEHLSGLNLFASTEEAQAGRQMLEDYPDDCPRYEHPLVITDPISGVQTIYASQMHTAAVVGLPFEQSEALLTQLHQYLYRPQNVHIHRWRTGDFVIWANFRIQHARGALDPNHERTLQRVCLSNGDPDVYENALPKRIVSTRIGSGMTAGGS